MVGYKIENFAKEIRAIKVRGIYVWNRGNCTCDKDISPSWISGHGFKNKWNSFTNKNSKTPCLGRKRGLVKV